MGIGDPERREVQKVIANLGRLEQLQETTLDGLIEALMEFSTREWVITQARDLKAKYAKSLGTRAHLRQALGGTRA